MPPHENATIQRYVLRPIWKISNRSGRLTSDMVAQAGSGRPACRIAGEHLSAIGENRCASFS